MKLEGARILVTGAGGFAGRWLVRDLLARGAIVAGYGPGRASRAGDCVQWYEGSVLDRSALGRAVGEFAPQGIAHLAAQSSAAESFVDPIGTFRANVSGTRRLLEVVASTAPRSRVLVVTSSDVYGPTEAGTRTDESHPLHPVSPYGLSKAIADRMATALADALGLDIIVARTFGHTGPGQAARFAIPAWAQQIAEIERGEQEPVLRVGNLEVTRDILDVRDVVAAYVLLLERGGAGRSFNVCTGQGVRLTEVLATMLAVARATIRVEPDPRRMRPADVPHLVGDPGALERWTSWTPAHPLSGTLHEVLEEWRSPR